MNDNFLTVTDFIREPGEKSFKHTFFQSDRLLVGLNVLRPGQAQSIHEHSDQDKFYYVVEGAGRFTVDDTTQTCAAGDLILAPAGAPHGVINDSAALLTFLTVIAPFG
ncbi:cupin domain-containing protein [Caldilinea sp.]|uniref:cupin domain-containing protein n=1 Tax=Caldilinea sp. TaxID=2293560 RepID=UPI002C888773|nr:cupin domain-containing protein [Anaerolineales bacterium]HQY90316.1 cupin domain-containing protein [Caldilinea sp.]